MTRLLDLIPDLEATVGDHLREHPDIAAFDARVAGRLPASFTRPWVRVTQLDARDTGNADHLIDYLIQFDCYAGSEPDHGQAEASALARTVRAVLAQMRGLEVGDAVIGSVVFSSMPRIPDLAFEPPRERYVLTASVYAHASP